MVCFAARARLATLILALAASAAVVIAPASALADGLIGKRLFPSTLAIDDPLCAGLNRRGVVNGRVIR